MATKHGITGSNYRQSDYFPTGLSPYYRIGNAKVGARMSKAPVGTVVCLISRQYTPPNPGLQLGSLKMEQYVWFTPEEEAFGEVVAVLSSEGWEDL